MSLSDPPTRAAAPVGAEVDAPRLRQRLLRLPPRWFAIGAGGLALTISGFFGGLAPATTPADEVPSVAPGTAVAAGPWRVTVTDARLLPDVSPLVAENDGDPWLVVLAVVEVTAPSSRQDMTDILRVSGVDGLLHDEPNQILLVRDTTNVSALQPGLPEKLAFCWEQSAKSPVPTVVDVEIAGKIYREDSLTGYFNWFDNGPVARLSAVDVTDRRTA